ncbi:MAG: hypothetical protein EOR60_15130 [Mesorhizobium sp.]|jgi:hypothetical protein|nr:MAG: hypothetical protein EOR60_15130 [Mesorhizobium sp.]
MTDEMKENHIAWMRRELASVTKSIEYLESGQGRYYSMRDGKIDSDLTASVLSDHKRTKAELEGLLKEYDGAA